MLCYWKIMVKVLFGVHFWYKNTILHSTKDWQTKSNLQIGKNAARQIEDCILLFLWQYNHAPITVNAILLQEKSESIFW